MGTACLWRKTWKRRGVACRRTPIMEAPTNSMCTIDRYDVSESDVMRPIRCYERRLAFCDMSPSIPGREYRASQYEPPLPPAGRVRSPLLNAQELTTAAACNLARRADPSQKNLNLPPTSPKSRTATSTLLDHKSSKQARRLPRCKSVTTPEARGRARSRLGVGWTRAGKWDVWLFFGVLGYAALAFVRRGGGGGCGDFAVVDCPD
jgi:hypothetical protein